MPLSPPCGGTSPETGEDEDTRDTLTGAPPIVFTGRLRNKLIAFWAPGV